MKNRLKVWIFPFIFCFVMIASCEGPPLGISWSDTERLVKEWWGEGVVDDALIEYRFPEDGKLRVTAQVVARGDTSEIMSYEFKKVWRKLGREWTISKGPCNENTKEYIIEAMNCPSLEVLVISAKNMDIMNGQLISCFEDGRYPANLMDVRKQIGKEKDRVKQERLLSFENNISCLVENTYHNKRYYGYGWADAIGDTTEWFPEYRGRIVYFPIEKHGKYARGYKLKASTSKGFLDYERLGDEWKPDCLK
jgi:hypothetical protein